MTYVAHALIELADGSTIGRGDPVPTDLAGFDELVAGGAVSEEEYDAAKDKSGPPTTVVIDGITYVQSAKEPDVHAS